MKELDTDYKEIPMSEITDEARQIAVRWGENMKDDFIAQKHKLASDIMNYAHRHALKMVDKQRTADARNVANRMESSIKPTEYSGQWYEKVLETPLVITRNTIPNV